MEQLVAAWSSAGGKLPSLSSAGSQDTSAARGSGGAPGALAEAAVDRAGLQGFGSHKMMLALANKLYRGGIGENVDELAKAMSAVVWRITNGDDAPMKVSLEDEVKMTLFVAVFEDFDRFLEVFVACKSPEDAQRLLDETWWGLQEKAKELGEHSAYKWVQRMKRRPLASFEGISPSLKHRIPGEVDIFQFRANETDFVIISSYRIIAIGLNEEMTLSGIDHVETRGNRIICQSRGPQELKVEVRLKHPSLVLTKAIKQLRGLISKDPLQRAKTFLVNDSQLEGWGVYDALKEFERMGVPPELRIYDQTPIYKLSPSYPRYLLVSTQSTENDLAGSASFRCHGRLPVVTFIHSNGAILARSAQPMTGFRNTTSQADERVVACLMTSGEDIPASSAEAESNNGVKNFMSDVWKKVFNAEESLYVIMDARSQIASMGNQMLGKGTENPANYVGSRVVFQNIENIHSLRSSFKKLVKLARNASFDGDFYRAISESGWVQQVKSVLRAGIALKEFLEAKTNVLVHCSDGWDRTAQICSTAMLLIDPYFRTMKGFQVLIEKEWIAFGHKFRDRCHGRPSDQEFSPVFLLWLDCIWQLTLQFPKAFEFSEAFLLFLAQQLDADASGTFLFNSEAVSVANNAQKSTVSLWSSHFMANPSFLNPDFAQAQKTSGFALKPILASKKIKLWENLFFGHDCSYIKL